MIGNFLVYSVRTYVNAKQDSASVGALAKAVYAYGYSATAYKNAPSISAEEVTLNIANNDTVTLTANFPAGDNNTVWTSSNDKIATVANGVVTPVFHGEATITATNNGEVVTAKITVINQYALVFGTNNECAQTPGTWRYHADGTAENDYAFVDGGEPYYDYEDNSVNATIEKISGSFRFRFLPFAYDSDGDNTYSLTGMITLNVSGKVIINGNALEVEAGVPKSILITDKETRTLTGTNSNDVYYIELKSSNLEVPAEGLVAKVSDIVVTRNVLEKKTNANVAAAPGNWFYHYGGTSFISIPHYTENGAIETTIKSISNNYMQLRYQPDFEVGTIYKLTFTVKTNINSTLSYCSAKAALTAGEAKTITHYGLVQSGTSSVTIGLTNYTCDELTLTVSDITVEKMEGTALEQKNMSGTRDNAGTWFYWVDGSTAAFNTAPALSEDGTLFVSATDWGTGSFRFRYQPKTTTDGVELAEGDNFRITFTVITSAKVNVERNYEGLVSAISATVEANTPTTFTLESTMTSGKGPIQISINKSYGANGILIVKDIVIEKNIVKTVKKPRITSSAFLRLLTPKSIKK